MRRSSQTSLAALGVTLALTGCPGSGSHKIGSTRVAAHPTKPVKLDATSADRFGSMGPMRGGASSNHAPVAFDTPQGWATKPDPSGMRLAGFSLKSSAESDCSISLVNGGTANLPANVNRWRKQMGLSEVDEATIRALPTRPVLGGPAVIVELDGSFSGMGGSPQAGWKMLGAIRPLENRSLVVKLTGPAAAVEAERKSFEALLDSLRASAEEEEDPGEDSHGGAMGNMPQDDGRGGGANPHGGANPNGGGTGANPHGGGAGGGGANPHGGGNPHGGEQPAPSDAATGDLQWTAQEGWAQQGPKPMRLVTFLAGPKQETECYVTLLGPNAGTLPANVNRWRAQVGQGPLDDGAIAALPKVKVLGGEAALLEVTGDYADMQGAKHSGYVLLGVLVAQPTRTVTVKMVGPEADVRAERARFLAFLESLR